MCGVVELTGVVHGCHAATGTGGLVFKTRGPEFYIWIRDPQMERKERKKKCNKIFVSQVWGLYKFLWSKSLAYVVNSFHRSGAC